MRSRPFKRDLRERVRDRHERHLYACKCRRRRIVRVDFVGTAAFPDRVRLLQGVESCAKRQCGRAMRLWWRMKRFSGAYA